MCGFIITNRQIKNLQYVNHFLKFRGPDKTTVFQRENITFVHNLLSITGKITEQPFNDNQFTCVFNGEIYNHSNFGDYQSDGQCIIPNFNKDKIDFFKKIDGEYAISILDFDKKILYLATDLFATKPLWFSFENKEFGISTYKSCLTRLNFKKVKKISANKFLEVDMNNFTITEKSIYRLDYNNQHKDRYEDWSKAFLKAVKKRSVNNNHTKFVGLSSGYDSGAICCALNILKIHYSTYTINRNEKLEIIKKRIEKNSEYSNYKIFDYINLIWIWKSKFLLKNAEDFICHFVNPSLNIDQYISYKKDKAAIGLSAICKQANKDKHRILLSGQGADEIYSDYGFNGERYNNNSQFGGIFPENLKDIYPWKNFYESSMEGYLMKEEMVAGSHGIEARYPFLDIDVVQEFLWLAPELKNRLYKAPVKNFLIQNEYPHHDKKFGFNIFTNIRFIDKIFHKMLSLYKK